MTSTFTGFSEEELKRIKSVESFTTSDPTDLRPNIQQKIKLISKPKVDNNKFRRSILKNQDLDRAIDNIEFSKCKLSVKETTTSPNIDIVVNDENENEKDDSHAEAEIGECIITEIEEENNNLDTRRNSSVLSSDIVKGVDNYNEDELVAHKVKLQELQLKQKLMEEQNKKRKEMLAKALADRTRQTEEEVLRLEKIKRELQVLDGQFSQDVAVLRKKIDQACLNYSEAEKQYLKVEKEFLQAKINLQKEKEKKELLTEHLCALITHNETRKAKKLETLMLELASDKIKSANEHETLDEDKSPVVIDGVDQRTGKMMEISDVS